MLFLLPHHNRHTPLRNITPRARIPPTAAAVVVVEMNVRHMQMKTQRIGKFEEGAPLVLPPPPVIELAATTSKPFLKKKAGGSRFRRGWSASDRQLRPMAVAHGGDSRTGARHIVQFEEGALQVLPPHPLIELATATKNPFLKKKAGGSRFLRVWSAGDQPPANGSGARRRFTDWGKLSGWFKLYLERIHF